MTFEFDGNKYAQASSHQKEWGQRLISELDLKGNERILDLGCGDGAITVQLADLVPEGSLLGIDASQGMIETAGNHRRPNLLFMVKDINSLDFNNEFDIIFSNATLHWVKDHDRLLKNVYASLKKSGVLRFNFAADGNCILSIANWSWVVFILILGAKYLNFGNKLVNYGNDAVLPFYILHQTIILVVGWFVITSDIGILPKFLFIIVVSFVLIMALYELLIRRINIVRFFFGMRVKN
ncbi:class I SAM-dependent methyltransferase [Chloroflexota bacterium]